MVLGRALMFRTELRLVHWQGCALSVRTLNSSRMIYQGNKSLRAYMTDNNARYSLPVVAKNLRELYRSKGAAAVNKLLPKSSDLRVRVGLARAWLGQPGKCTVMINGVHW
jgi:hypothetical protein